MNQSGFKDWKVLCWNVRGLNSEARQLAVKQKNDESGCSVVCLQETKVSSQLLISFKIKGIISLYFLLLQQYVSILI